MRLRLGLRPDPAGGAYSAPPDPLAGNGRGAPGKGREKETRGREAERREGKGTGGMGRGMAIPPNENPGYGLDIGSRLISVAALT